MLCHFSKWILVLSCFFNVIELLICQYAQAGYGGQAPVYQNPSVSGQRSSGVPIYYPQNQMPQEGRAAYQPGNNQNPGQMNPYVQGYPVGQQGPYGQNYPQGQQSPYGGVNGQHPSTSFGSYPVNSYGTGYTGSREYALGRGLYERGVTPQPGQVVSGRSGSMPYNGNGCQQIILAPYARYLYGRPCNDAIGSRCYLTCEQGFDLIGSCFRVCGTDRRWSGSEMLCVRPGITCPSANFHESIRVMKGCQNMAGFSCTLACKSAGVPTASGVAIRNGVIYCQVDGRWSHDPSLITCAAGSEQGNLENEQTASERGIRNTANPSNTGSEMSKGSDVEAIAATGETVDGKASGAIERESQSVSPGKLIYSGSSMRHSDEYHHGKFWISRSRDRGKVTSSATEREQGEQKLEESLRENLIIYDWMRKRDNLSLLVRIKRADRQQVTCKPLNPPKNGQSSGQCAPGLPGKICRFNCITNFTMSGSASITCGLNGEWSSPPARCVK